MLERSLRLTWKEEDDFNFNIYEEESVGTHNVGVFRHSPVVGVDEALYALHARELKFPLVCDKAGCSKTGEDREDGKHDQDDSYCMASSPW